MNMRFQIVLFLMKPAEEAAHCHHLRVLRRRLGEKIKSDLHPAGDLSPLLSLKIREREREREHRVKAPLVVRVITSISLFDAQTQSG